MSRRQTNRGDGFTLIEVLAVVALVGSVFFVAMNFYTDLSRASTRAADHTREIRRATAILDRVARDFEHTFLMVKPPEADPLTHPWLFLGESHFGSVGADHVKFTTRNHDPSRASGHESDLALVSYVTDRDIDDRIAVYRWSSPQLPESLDRSFPSPDDPSSMLLADGLDHFGVLFLDGVGEPVDEWDSTTLVASGEIPAAVEIQVAVADLDALEPADPTVYRRRVTLPVRPLDLQAILDAAAGRVAGDENEEEEPGEDGEPDSNTEPSEGQQARTWGDCINAAAADPSDPFVTMFLGLLSANSNMPFNAGDVPPELASFVNPQCR